MQEEQWGPQSIISSLHFCQRTKFSWDVWWLVFLTKRVFNGQTLELLSKSLVKFSEKTVAWCIWMESNMRTLKDLFLGSICVIIFSACKALGLFMMLLYLICNEVRGRCSFRYSKSFGLGVYSSSIYGFLFNKISLYVK